MFEEQSFGPVRIIPGPGKGRYPYCHSVYIEEAGVLIDPGSDRQRLQELKARGAVRKIWLTHWHEDHHTHLDLFPEVPLWIGEHDAPPLRSLDLMLDWYGISSPPIRDFFSASLLEQSHFRPRCADRLLKDGEVIDLGCVTVEVIHAPGHTPGHLAYYFREPQVLLLGDVDLTPFGPWYGDRDSSIEQLMATVEKLRKIPAKVWLTSHEQGVFADNPGSLWDTYLQVIQRREDKLLELLRSGPTLEEIVNAWIVYGREREPKEFFEFGERANIQKHLDRMVKEGTVAFDAGVFSLRGS
ncbi:MAG: MBL fold metallo-hydrolase [Geobacteraceae bacterium]|nr:MBL fold metallo-hydrolase [Geobacteraceae bacterium]